MRGDPSPWRARGWSATAAGAATLVVTLAVVSPASGSPGRTAPKRQTKAQAEITLLHATKALAALSPRLIDPRTRLVRTNTRAVCKGLGRARHGKYLRFRCVIANGRLRFLVSYVAFGQNGRVLRKIANLGRG
jgi:hypothetical protein